MQTVHFNFNKRKKGFSEHKKSSFYLLSDWLSERILSWKPVLHSILSEDIHWWIISQPSSLTLESLTGGRRIKQAHRNYIIGEQLLNIKSAYITKVKILKLKNQHETKLEGRWSRSTRNHSLPLSYNWRSISSNRICLHNILDLWSLL